MLVTDRAHLPRGSAAPGSTSPGSPGVPASSIRRALAAVFYEIASLIRAVRRR